MQVLAKMWLECVSTQPCVITQSQKQEHGNLSFLTWALRNGEGGWHNEIWVPSAEGKTPTVSSLHVHSVTRPLLDFQSTANEPWEGVRCRCFEAGYSKHGPWTSRTSIIWEVVKMQTHGPRLRPAEPECVSLTRSPGLLILSLYFKPVLKSPGSLPSNKSVCCLALTCYVILGMSSTL